MNPAQPGEIILDVFLNGQLVHTIRLDPATLSGPYDHEIGYGNDASGDPLPNRPRKKSVLLPLTEPVRVLLDLQRSNHVYSFVDLGKMRVTYDGNPSQVTSPLDPVEKSVCDASGNFIRREPPENPPDEPRIVG